MISVKILNFYNTYMNNIITSYYVIGSGSYVTNETLNYMELGILYGNLKRKVPESWYEESERDIENNMPYERLSLIHPDLC